MIGVGALNRLGAARVTAFVLMAAWLRSLLSPLGETVSAAAFAACLGMILALEWPRAQAGEQRLGIGAAILLGAGTGALLALPLAFSSRPSLSTAGFWQWGAAIAVIATLEESVIRGPLQRRWAQEAGPLAALVVPALTFALIHLPAYGLSSLPLDLAVGLGLSGLRAATGRVFPCAIAHVMADWAAWFWS